MESGEVHWFAITITSPPLESWWWRSQSQYPQTAWSKQEHYGVERGHLRKETWNGEVGNKVEIDGFSKSFYNKLRARGEGRAEHVSVEGHVETHMIVHGVHSPDHWRSVLKLASEMKDDSCWRHLC